jgi:hypothetical protein
MRHRSGGRRPPGLELRDGLLEDWQSWLDDEPVVRNVVDPQGRRGLGLLRWEQNESCVNDPIIRCE